MISYVTVCLLVHGEKGSISNTFCHAKREYSFSVRPISCTPAFYYLVIPFNQVEMSNQQRQPGVQTNACFYG